MTLAAQNQILMLGSRTLTNVAFFRWEYREVIFSYRMVLSTFFSLGWALCVKSLARAKSIAHFSFAAIYT
jgi:hypothetical protein